jgi:hypothetical protein
MVGERRLPGVDDRAQEAIKGARRRSTARFMPELNSSPSSERKPAVAAAVMRRWR